MGRWGGAHLKVVSACGPRYEGCGRCVDVGYILDEHSTGSVGCAQVTQAIAEPRCGCSVRSSSQAQYDGLPLQSITIPCTRP